MDEKKLAIMKDILLDESHSLEDLKRLVSKSKNFLKIEQETGKIIISNEYYFTIREKIVLFIIGKYFCDELGFEKEKITSSKISEEIEISKTSLSGSLGDLVKEHIFSKEESAYDIKYYQIKKQLDILNNKYILKIQSPVVKNIKQKKKKSRNSVKQAKRVVVKEIKMEKQTKEEIKSKLKIEGIEYSGLQTVFNLYNNKLIILKGFKSNNIEESHIKSTLLAFIAYKLYYNLDEINSSILRETLKDSGVEKLISLSTKLKNYTGWITHKKGQIGCTNTSYRITDEGYRQSLNLLKDIINKTSVFQLKLSNSRVKNREIAPDLQISKETLDKNISEIARIEKFDENKLRIAFDFQEDHIRIIEPIKERTRKIMQIKNLLILGFIIKRIYQKDKFNCAKLLKISNITSDRLDLLDSNKSYKKYFSVTKPKTAMSLIFAGEKKANECLAKYLNNEKFEL